MSTTPRYGLIASFASGQVYTADEIVFLNKLIDAQLNSIIQLGGYGVWPVPDPTSLKVSRNAGYVLNIQPGFAVLDSSEHGGVVVELPTETTFTLSGDGTWNLFVALEVDVDNDSRLTLVPAFTAQAGATLDGAQPIANIVVAGATMTITDTRNVRSVLAWSGVWDALREFVPGNVVSYSGALWVALQATTNVSPTTGANWTEFAASSGTPFNFIGAWSSGTTYGIGDAVQSGGSLWYCVLGNTNQLPPNATYWSLLASAGTNGTNGATWYQGAGTPAGGLGDDGDFYVNTSNNSFYQRISGSWTIIGNFKGDTGPPGPTANFRGAWATATVYALNDAVQDGTPVSSFYCYNGHTSGASTEPGAGGSWTSYWYYIAQAGATGLTGAAGSTWYVGSGTPSGGAGVNGDFYLNGATGDVYQKITGTWTIQCNIQGPVGAAGPTNLCALFVQTAPVTVANTITETSLVGTVTGSKTIPANFADAGMVIRGSLAVEFSSTTGTPATMNFKIKLGSTVICATGAQTPAVVTGERATLNYELVFRSVGATASVIGRGVIGYGDSAITAQFWPLTDSAATVDTTGTLVLDTTITYGTATVTDTITCETNNAEAFVPGSVPSSGNATKFQNVPISNTSPTDGQIWRFDNSSGTWKIVSLPFTWAGTVTEWEDGSANVQASIDSSTGHFITHGNGVESHSESNTATVGPQFDGLRARGTISAPSAVQSGDRLGGVSGRGYGASAYHGANAAIVFSAAENFSDTANGSEITFGTTPLTTLTRKVWGRWLPTGTIQIEDGSGTDGAAGTVMATIDVTGLAQFKAMAATRIKRRAPSITQSATPAINTDITDVAHLVGLAQAITSMTSGLTGTPVEGDVLYIDITDNGTARAIAWGSSFESSAVALPTTTVLGVRLDITLRWNTVTSKWRCVAVTQAGGGGGATAFTGLSDAPSSYSGQGGKAVTVKSDESGLEFTVGGGAFKGPYLAATAYTVGQVVSNFGNLYYCTANATNVQPGYTTNWQNNWMPITKGLLWSLGFNGSNSTVDVPSETVFNIGGTNPCCIEWWENRTTDVNNAAAISRDNNEPSFVPWMVGYSDVDGNTYGYASSAGASWDVLSGISFGTLTLNTWTHYALTYDGAGNWVAYQKGVQTGTATSSTATNTSTNPLVIGRYVTTSGTIEGGIGPVRISTIQRYSTGFTPPLSFVSDNHTALLLAMTEGAGNPFDSSGNGYNGTANNCTWTARAN